MTSTIDPSSSPSGRQDSVALRRVPPEVTPPLHREMGKSGARSGAEDVAGDVVEAHAPAGPRTPRYLRVVITTRCPMQCPFCHHEGLKPSSEDAGSRVGRDGSPSFEEWCCMLEAAVEAGVRKLKFLGGEPLVYRDLPRLIARVKRVAPGVDVSMITSGAAQPSALAACFEAGLDRANLSIHGWTERTFARNGSKALFELRRRNLKRLLERGRPVKLNYVYTGASCEADLAAFLDDVRRPPIAGRGVVVSILDDLSNPGMGPDTIRSLLRRLCGTLPAAEVDDDPYSLPAERYRWPSGLCVEVKSSRLGDLAPWNACGTCDKRAQCREGTFALRLDPTGRVRFCMDRLDLGFSLIEPARAGRDQGAKAWRRAVAGAVRPGFGQEQVFSA